MDQHRDWSWLNRMAAPIRARHRPARPKPPRLVATYELFDLGLKLMTAAERKKVLCDRATTYRDGLMIALLAARPLRAANFIGLALGRTLIRRGEQWWIQIPAAETKTNEPIKLPWPEPLIVCLEKYLTDHRTVLVQRHGRWTRAIGQQLWLSRDGSPMTRRAIYDRITGTPVEAWGERSIRTCSAIARRQRLRSRIRATSVSRRASWGIVPLDHTKTLQPGARRGSKSAYAKLPAFTAARQENVAGPLHVTKASSAGYSQSAEAGCIEASLDDIVSRLHDN